MEVNGIMRHIDIDSIENESSPGNIINWNSLKHMNLIVTLEEGFELEFNDEEISHSMNYALIVNISKNK